MDGRGFSKCDTPTIPPDAVSRLIQELEAAHHCRNWSIAEGLREQIANLGWEVMDIKDGPMFRKLVGKEN